MTSVVENPVAPQTHGVGANLIFPEHGLDPYWGLVSVFEPDLKNELDTVDALGETFELEKSKYWQGKIADPNGDCDGGLYEYKLALWTDDGPSSKGADFTFRPGYPNAIHSDTGDEIDGLPDDCPESIRVSVEASNLDPDEILELLQELAIAIDLNSEYFEQPGDWSSVYKLETYLRVERALATEELSGPGALLEQLSRFGTGDGRGEHKWDHEEITGHYESVALDPDTWSALIPEQRLPKFLKCYQPEHVRSAGNDDDPLFHHKLESRYWSDFDGDSIQWSRIDESIQELRETTLSALHWCGVSVDADADHFVADEYFRAESLQEEIEIVENPLDSLAEEQTLDARADLIDPSASPTEFDVLELAADGGAKHYQELANQAGASESTVYRAVEQFDSILEADDGEIQFRNKHIRRTISDVLERFQSAKDRTVDALRRIANRATPLGKAHGDDPSALEQWANAHAVEIRDRFDTLEIEVSHRLSRRELLEIIRDGIQAAEQSPLLTKKFERADLHWIDTGGDPHRNWTPVRVDGSTKKILGIEPLD
jgi:hypothetical protein